jgi:hypothetical protein
VAVATLAQDGVPGPQDLGGAATSLTGTPCAVQYTPAGQETHAGFGCL